MPTEKQINQLPDANRYLSSTDFLAFEDANNVTYKISGDRLGISPYAATITSGQWSGSGSDYYITVSASNVTADSILIPHYDNASLQYLQGPVWCVPAAGSFTIHTSALPTGTVTILVQFVGVMGEAQYQVLADVYSTSQAVAKADIVNNLVSTATDKPLSAAQGKALNEAITQSATKFAQFIYNYNSVTIPANSGLTVQPTSVIKPDGYATLSPLEIATGSISVLTRGFQATSGEIYLVNTSSSPVTVTPTFRVMLYKTGT